MSKVIVVGASLGGVSALLQLAAALPAHLAAPMLIVLHIGEQPSVLPSLLARNARLEVSHGRDGETLRAGHFYVAPPDQHMLLEGRQVQAAAVGRGSITRVRPSIRCSVGGAGVPDVIGVVLTGNLDDGTAGLQTIKSCGGIAIVQDPDDAAAPSMPRSALKYVDVDHCVALPLMPLLLASLATTPPRPALPTPHDVPAHEQALTLSEGIPWNTSRRSESRPPSSARTATARSGKCSIPGRSGSAATPAMASRRARCRTRWRSRATRRWERPAQPAGAGDPPADHGRPRPCRRRRGFGGPTGSRGEATAAAGRGAARPGREESRSGRVRRPRDRCAGTARRAPRTGDVTCCALRRSPCVGRGRDRGRLA